MPWSTWVSEKTKPLCEHRFSICQCKTFRKSSVLPCITGKHHMTQWYAVKTRYQNTEILSRRVFGVNLICRQQNELSHCRSIAEIIWLSSAQFVTCTVRSNSFLIKLWAILTHILFYIHTMSNDTKLIWDVWITESWSSFWLTMLVKRVVEEKFSSRSNMC